MPALPYPRYAEGTVGDGFWLMKGSPLPCSLVTWVMSLGSGDLNSYSGCNGSPTSTLARNDPGLLARNDPPAYLPEMTRSVP